MSTRSTTHFLGFDGRLVANIYRHSDGYPEGHGQDLQRFFNDVEEQTPDTRYGDPSYLAAKLVVWLANEFAHGEQPLDFLSVGVLIQDPSDIEYYYEIDCEHRGEDGRPVVRCFKVGDPEQVEIPVLA